MYVFNLRMDSTLLAQVRGWCGGQATEIGPTNTQVPDHLQS